MEKLQDSSQGNRSADNTRSMSTPSYPQSNNPAVPHNPADILVVDAENRRCSGPPHADHGIVGDLIDLITTYFYEYRTATSRHPGAASIAEVKGLNELRNKFSIMFGKDRGGLDQRLAQAEGVRKPLIWNFLAIILGFHRGINLYSRDMRDTLLRDTHRVVEQAEQNFRFVSPNTLESDPPLDIVDFSRKEYLDIKSRVDNVGEQLPITSFMHVRGALEIGLGERSLFRYLPFEQNSRRKRSINAILDAKQLSTHLEFPGMHSSFSGSSVHGNIDSLPATATSSSASQAGNATEDAVSSASTAASSDCTNCRATQIICVGSQKHLEIFDSEQYLMIWDRLLQTTEPYLALFDSGASDNFIIRSAAHERGLIIYPLPNKGKIVRLPGGLQVHASEYVQPDWRLLIGRNRHNKFHFIILEELPNGLQLVVGERASNELGIHRHADTSLLVAHLDDGADRSMQELLNRAQQLHAGSTRRDQAHQALNKKRADAVQASQARTATRLPSQAEIKSSQGEQQTRPKT